LIGLTTPYLGPDYFAQIVAAAAGALFERDLRLMVCLAEHKHDRETSLLESFTHGVIDGALLILPSQSQEELHLLRERLPIVIIDPVQPIQPIRVGRKGIPVVSAAHREGARLMTEYLIGLGHKHIGVVSGPMSGLASQQRLSGDRLALAEYRLPYNESLIFSDTAFMVEDGIKAGKYLLDLHLRPEERPTAIFAFNDAMAIGVLQEARKRSLRVPEDLSIAGFDDVQIAQCAIPRITTVRQPLQELGRVAVDLLSRLIAGHSLEETRVELSTQLEEDKDEPKSTSSPRAASPLEG